MTELPGLPGTLKGNPAECEFLSSIGIPKQESNATHC